MAAVRHVFLRSAVILVFYLVLSDVTKAFYVLRLNDGTGFCSAVAVGRELKSFSTSKFSMERKVADKSYLAFGFSLRVI